MHGLKDKDLSRVASYLIKERYEMAYRVMSGLVEDAVLCKKTFIDLLSKLLELKKIEINNVNALMAVLDFKCQRLSIGLTSKCNVRCISCGYHQSKENKSDIDDVAVDNILNSDATKHLSYVYFCGNGEPLMAKRFFDLVGHFSANKVRTGVNTNGQLLYALADKIINSGLDEIHLSLQAGTKDAYESFVRKGNFEQLLKGIKKINQLSEDIGLKESLIKRFIIVTHEDNIKTLKEIIDIAAENNVKQISLQSMGEITDLVKGKSILNNVQFFKDFLHTCKEYACKRNVLLSMDYAIEEALFRNTNIDRDSVYSSCNSSQTLDCLDCFKQLEIIEDGSVRTCGYPSPTYWVGNINKNSLDEIWNGSVLNNMREGLIIGQPKEFCKKCNLRKPIDKKEFQQNILKLLGTYDK